ncbi:hypothetical protein [Pedobacter sp. CFBP9032]|uniref:hypothetical protein n=1 Tax=Pedobacter sp. CFBP9032 TaxID=3096539 RepID=UPI002A69B1DC|nr:hypothetical protein [Pedobacter sp. CFBP9032]MDY0905735.1 hypothetical protein [Pedobacter sp. CFBP9032]
MEYIIYQNDKIMLKGSKSPLLISVILFLTSFLFFLLPIYGMTLNLFHGNGITFFSLIIIAIFFMLGYYLLRISLWNTFGKEIIWIGHEKIVYKADYGWFKGDKKEIYLKNLNYLIKPCEFEKNNMRVLILESDKSKIECVVQCQ